MNEVLDIFGQNPRLSRLYTQLCFCFPLPENTPQSHEEVVHSLRDGLQTLSSNFPWVAGQVTKGEDGLFKIFQFLNSPELVVQESGGQLMKFDELRRDGFPFSALEETLVASRRTLPDRLDEPAPVLSIQITFMDGGVLLTFSAQHNCMDMAGQCQIIYLLSKACRGEQFTDEELRTGNMDRSNIIPLLESPPDKPIPPEQDLEETAIPETPNGDEQEKGVWSYFLFSATSLASLKTLAMQHIDSEFISTDDALSAFVWKHVTLARSKRLSSTAVKSTFERQVDVRRHLNIPSTYTGNAVHKVSTTSTIEELLHVPLGQIASRLRASLGSSATLAHQAREAATSLHRELYASKRHTTSVKRTKVPSTNIKMSSWAKEKCYDFDFGGILGKPEAVCRPNFEGWEGLAYFMPRRLDGEIAVALNLREADLERLRGDEEFGRYGRYVG